MVCISKIIATFTTFLTLKKYGNEKTIYFICSYAFCDGLFCAIQFVI